ncbi:hypothetical protein F5883DRAFT_511192 [Diaporthe sp. PMI_573]|nr:hypothetical protein F5883DRAFT_511192 [Diaporthaceae sp. PMI_573]
MSNSMSIPCWTANENIFSQFSSTPSTPVLFQPDPMTMQDTEQEQGQASSAVTAITETEDAVARIGSVLDNGKFACDVEGCRGKTFARLAEFRRHHTTHHASNKPNFWCQVSSCRRSMSGGGEAFHRKDNLDAHVRSIHSGAQHS